jgi:hypothetical protein
MTSVQAATASVGFSPTRHFSYETAAVEFELPERWLRRHIKELPHREFGRYVRFSVADMLDISAKFAAQTSDGESTAEATASGAVPDIQPSSRRRAGK